MPQAAFSLLDRLPSQCRVCHAWPARALCEACIERFAQPQNRCQRCAIALPYPAQVCGSCLTTPPALTRCLAAVSYAFPWTSLIHDFKFHSQPGLSRVLAQLMLATPWVEPTLDEAHWLIPIALTPQRLQSRGYNQADLLSRGMHRAKTQAQWLVRTQPTPVQHTLSRAQRLRAQAHAFVVPDAAAAKLQGCAVVLVDDVMTTGATLQAAARALLAAGVAQVSAVVLARTESPHGGDPAPR